MIRVACVLSLAVVLFAAPAAAQPCLPLSGPAAAAPGFDFSVTATVEGPDIQGLFTYEYRVVRKDNGDVDYGTPTHLGLVFSCETHPAATLITGGREGVELASSTVGVCGYTLPSTAADFQLPGSKTACGNTGLRIDFCEGAFAVGADEPADAPVLVLRFRSLSDPVDGHWFMEGSPSSSRESVSADKEQQLLSASDKVPVPSCLVALPTEHLSWGTLKQIYD